LSGGLILRLGLTINKDGACLRGHRLSLRAPLGKNLNAHCGLDFRLNSQIAMSSQMLPVLQLCQRP
jgi:hypothetical protein